MKKIVSVFLSTFLCFVLMIPQIHAEENHLKTIPEKTFTDSELQAISDSNSAPRADWYHSYTDYGSPVLEQDGYYDENQDFISQFVNKSTLPAKYSESHSKSKSVTISAASGVDYDSNRFKSKISGSIGVNISVTHTITKTITVPNIPPQYGFNIYLTHRKYSVPTYKVTKYSASMGGQETREYVGETILYVPAGMATSDIKLW